MFDTLSRSLFYSGIINGFIIVYSITDVKSFEEAKSWVEKAQSISYETERPSILLVGGQIDSKLKRQVPKEMAHSYSQQMSKFLNFKMIIRCTFL